MSMRYRQSGGPPRYPDPPAYGRAALIEWSKAREEARLALSGKLMAWADRHEKSRVAAWIKEAEAAMTLMADIIERGRAGGR